MLEVSGPLRVNVATVVPALVSLLTLTPDDGPPALLESPRERLDAVTPLTGSLKTMEIVLRLTQPGMSALLNCPAPLASS